MNETKPLLGTNRSESNGHQRAEEGIGRITMSRLSLGSLGVTLLGVGILIGRTLNHSPSIMTISTPPPPPSSPKTEDPRQSTGRNRRSCRIYGDRLKFAGVLQTSIGDPSQQWSHVPCYVQPKKNNILLWAGQDDNLHAADINGYGTPDAILRTDFSRRAFPNRQPIVGFGAAFTEASSLNYQSLSEEAKERLMELFFGKSGIGYSIGA